MKKILFGFLAAGAMAVTALGQTLSEGIDAIYYSRYKTAQDIFEKLIAKDAKNTEAVYWLGQAYIQNIASADGPQKARDLFENALKAKPSDPWLLVGMANTDYLLLQDKETAKQRCEQAIAYINKEVRKKHRPQMLADIYTAIGRASAQGSKVMGDPEYAIPLLKKAIELDGVNPRPCIFLGQNYLKLGPENGGEAYSAYSEAMRRNPKFALAPYLVGGMYQSQHNYIVMNDWYQKAIEADPNFPATYLTYFLYFIEGDVNKAKEFLDKFVEVAEQSCDTKFFQADFSYVAGRYQEAIDLANKMKGECSTYADLYLLIAKAEHRLANRDAARVALDEYFKIAPASAIDAAHYAAAGYVAKEIPGKEADAIAYLKKAYELDTTAYRREIFVDSISYAYEKLGTGEEEYYLWLKERLVNPATLSGKSQVALAVASYKAKDYDKAEELFTMLNEKYPEEQFSYYYLQQVALEQDTTKTKAIPYIKKFIQFLENKGVESNKQTLLYEYYLLGDYYANIERDFETSLLYFQKMADLDPTNQNALDAVEQLKKIVEARKKEQAATTKPKGGKSNKK